MHYVGMAAYHVSGIVEWNVTYMAASVACSVGLSIVSLYIALRTDRWYSLHVSTATLVLAIISLHFTGMAAVSVTPLAGDVTNGVIFEAMAVAVAGVSLFIIGTGVASHMIDSQARTENTLRLRYMALNDPLTGLPNRTSFGDHLERELTRAQKEEHKLAVIGIDLNRFKEINDLRGHSAGDQGAQDHRGTAETMLPGWRIRRAHRRRRIRRRQGLPRIRAIARLREAARAGPVRAGPYP